MLLLLMMMMQVLRHTSPSNRGDDDVDVQAVARADLTEDGETQTGTCKPDATAFSTSVVTRSVDAKVSPSLSLSLCETER